MKNIYLGTLLSLLLFSWGHSQNTIWRTSSDREVSKLEKLNRASLPTEYQVFELDVNSLKNSLKPAASYKNQDQSSVTISFPNAKGDLVAYSIYAAPVMEKELAAKFPQISSYLGRGVKNKNELIRFSITSFGLHAMLYSPEEGTSYIDSYTKDLKNYIIYNRENLVQRSPMHCLTEQNTDAAIELESALSSNATPNSLGVYREYRLAMACTIEYAAYHVNAGIAIGLPATTELEKKAIVLSAMVTTMTRVNFIYERDLGIHMNLVANNDDIIFITTDNFSNNDARELLLQSQVIIDQIIGSFYYDIGHTVSTNSGGLAQVMVPCRYNYKARGVTGISFPVGDAFDVDFLSHEMGHQFGARHTFNADCSGNRNDDTAVEPGSGSTIMAYANVCGPNVKYQSDPFFHSVSINQIKAFTSSIYAVCSTNTATLDSLPIINAGGNRIIPKSTPFYLEGTVDYPINKSALTYTWEQANKEPSIQPPVATAVGGPNFLYVVPSTSTRRYFPNFTDVLAGINRRWEVLPSVERVLKFNFLARDNNILLGGQTGFDEMEVTIAAVGPFVISYPNSGTEQWQGGTTQNVTWNVAGTTANNINTSHVNIKFSADNGATFILLASNTPNDGSENILVPQYTTTEARIMIEPVDNIYYAISKKFETTQTTASIKKEELNNFKIAPNPTSNVVFIEFNAENKKEITLELYDLKGRLVLKEVFKNSASLFKHELDISMLQSGIYFITLSDGRTKETRKLVKN